MRKKILFVITKSNFGGAQRYVFDLATSLPQDEFEASVAFGQYGRLADELKKAGIRTHEIRSLVRDIAAGRDVRSFFEIFRLFRMQKPDIVHLNSSKAGGLGALAARCAGVQRIIFTVHGWPFREKRTLPVRAVLWTLSWLTALLSHAVIVVSNYDLHTAQKMPFIKNKVVRIYNGIAPINFLPAAKDGSIRVITNAELTDNKNLFIAIDAVVTANRNGANLLYSIMGEGELRAKIEEHIRKNGYQDFVMLLGFVPEGKRHLKNFDIFFLPSKKEGLPYVLIEAGFAQLPVVASRTGGIPEIIQDKKSGLLFDSSDVDGFADGLLTFSRDENLRQSMGRALYHDTVKKFTLERMLSETHTCYRS